MDGSFRVGDWQVEPQLNLLQRGDQSVHLAPKVMDVLCTLAEHAGEVLGKERLIHAVWPDTFVTDEVLTNAISQLRKAFEDDPAEPRFIRTIPRRGHQLIADILFPEEPTTESTRRRLLRKLGQDGMGEVTWPRKSLRDRKWLSSLCRELIKWQTGCAAASYQKSFQATDRFVRSPSRGSAQRTGRIDVQKSRAVCQTN